MKAKPIYVEITMRTEMDKLWEHTQTPELHEQWDLRFSEITYLPRDDENERQQFLYRTRIGFGLDIAGKGETKATTNHETGQRISTLIFGSEQPISLIRKGGGYWKYKPQQEGEKVTFITQYDYQTRFGVIGSWGDRMLFRPLFGYATAWSFDMLRIWIEKGISPAVSLQRAYLHYFAVIVLAILWFYQGIVPKLLYPESGEMELLKQTNWFAGWEALMLPVIGAAEIGFALLLCLKHRSRWVFRIQTWALILLGIAAISGDPELLTTTFNPLSLNLAMCLLGVFAAATTHDLPNAARCLRRPGISIKPQDQGGEEVDFDLRASFGK